MRCARPGESYGSWAFALAIIFSASGAAHFPTRASRTPTEHLLKRVLDRSFRGSVRIANAYSAALAGANRAEARVIEASSRLAQSGVGAAPSDIVTDVVELSQGAIELAANVAVAKALDESQAELLESLT